jgi:hypothetical protein
MMNSAEAARRRFGPRAAAIIGTATIGVALGAVGFTNAMAATTGAIIGNGGKCVDVAGASSASGARVRLYRCNGSDAQQWTTGNSDNSIRALGKCLDVAAAGTANGARVQLYDCNGTWSQRWTASSGRLINTNANKCLDATGISSADGTPLQIRDCTGGANQTWAIPDGGGGDGVGGVGGVGSPPTPSPPPSAGPATMAAAPYLHPGWGSPPDPRTVMSATGVHWFTMAFILSDGGCNPVWDGGRPLTGGVEQVAIDRIRSAGGDVMVSFGGGTGPWLEQYCGSASALAGAYQQVINAYGLKAIDVDIEKTPYHDGATQQRTVDALKAIKAANPGITVYITISSGTTGPDSSLIDRAAASGLAVDGWAIMTFDWGNTGGNQGQVTMHAVDGLHNVLKNAYHYTDDQAYRHSGISSMNGITDEYAIVTVNDFRTMLSYAQLRHLARFTYWSANRDRPCPGDGYPNDDTCSGVSQAAWDYTRIVAQYEG